MVDIPSQTPNFSPGPGPGPSPSQTQSHSTMLADAKEFIRGQDGVLAPLSLTEEEIDPQLQVDRSLDAYPLERTTECIDVPPYRQNSPSQQALGQGDPQSEFSFFEDGKQRTIQIGHIPVSIGNSSLLIPVHYFSVSAVVLHRVDGRLHVWRAPRMETGICVERSLVPNQRLAEEFEAAGLHILNTNATGGDYYQLRQRALHRAKLARLECEDTLLQEWRMSEEASQSFCVVDGVLMNLRNAQNVARCVGVSKSFGTRFFDRTTHTRIFRMQEGQRSWAFRFKSPGDDPGMGGKDRVSWYLRLRTQPGCDPEYGMVRVEISPHHAKRTTEFADRFSRSLMAERLPSTYPDPRWDRHLYCIRSCEMYLNSIMPSVQTIRASMGGI